MNYLFLIIHKIIVDTLVNSVNISVLKQGKNVTATEESIMEIIFNKGDKVNVKGYRSEGTVNTTFTTESRDMGLDIVRIVINGNEITVVSSDVSLTD